MEVYLMGIEIGFVGLLALSFIILKLTNVISWSWIWVLSPIWIPIALLLILFFFAVLIALIRSRRR
jgi:hypothetical protein